LSSRDLRPERSFRFAKGARLLATRRDGDFTFLLHSVEHLPLERGVRAMVIEEVEATLLSVGFAILRDSVLHGRARMDWFGGMIGSGVDYVW
jgi:hypothetical protein